MRPGGAAGPALPALAVALAMGVASPATAGGPGSLWERVAGPGERARARYAGAMAEADDLATRAAEQQMDGESQRGEQTALKAAEAYEVAASFLPGAAEPHFRAAEVLAGHFLEGPISGQLLKPAERALRHWNEFQRLAPLDPRLPDVLFRRSLVYTKIGGPENFKRAAAEYDDEIAMLDPGSTEPAETALLLANAAEIHMALGELDIAIDYYSRAVDKTGDTMAATGLAVALDRDGQGARAREVMRTRGVDWQTLNDALNEGRIFFVPEGDVWWYRALRVETLGNLEGAAAFYRQYLRYQGTSRYAARAREVLKEVEARAKLEARKHHDRPLDPNVEHFRISVEPVDP